MDMEGRSTRNRPAPVGAGQVPVGFPVETSQKANCSPKLSASVDPSGLNPARAMPAGGAIAPAALPSAVLKHWNRLFAVVPPIHLRPGLRTTGAFTSVMV